MNKEEILQFLRRNKNKLNKYGVKKIGLFGSYVKEKDIKGSDIDLIVKFEPGKKNFDNYMDLKFFLEESLNNKVDLVIEGSIKEELKEEILGSAKYA